MYMRDCQGAAHHCLDLFAHVVANIQICGVRHGWLKCCQGTEKLLEQLCVVALLPGARRQCPSADCRCHCLALAPQQALPAASEANPQQVKPRDAAKLA